MAHYFDIFGVVAIDNTTKLSDKQKAFCEEYLKDFHGSAAAIRAGYSKANAGQLGWQVLRMSKAQKYLNKLKEKRAKKCDLDVAKVVAELMKVGFSNIGDYFDNSFTLKDLDQLTKKQKASIQKIEVKVWVGGKDGRAESKEVKFHMYDKLSALEKLGKYLNMFSERLNNPEEKPLFPETIVFKNQVKAMAN